MSNTLTINTSLVGSSWQITGSMSAGTLPQEIFMYNNTGSSSLGTYVGVCSINELSRLQVFSGTPLPIFGNKFVRYGTLDIVVPLSTDPTGIITTIVASVNLLITSYKTKINTSQVFTIL